MASMKFNKIVRKNNSMKPWKNTSQILSSCIRKMYESNEVKNDMLPSKEALLTPANESPLRSWQLMEKTAPAPAPAPRLKGCTPKKEETCVAAPLVPKFLNNTKKGSLAANHKLLKSPNYKIYASRRSGSSASSTNGSLFKRYEKQRQNRGAPTNHSNFLHTAVSRTINPCNGSLSCIFNSVTPVRNQHIRLTPDYSETGTSSAIRQELMPIDAALKGRIALRRSRYAKDTAESIRAHRQELLRGWYHPPSNDLLFPSAVKQTAAAVESEQTPKPYNSRLAKLARPMGHKALTVGDFKVKTRRPRLTTECAVPSTPAARKPHPPLAAPLQAMSAESDVSTTQAAEEDCAEEMDSEPGQCKFPTATAQVVEAVLRATEARFSRSPYQLSSY